MARVRSEGYGAEWIEVPDDVLCILGTRPPYCDELIFIVSRSDENFMLAFLLERRANGHNMRDMILSSSWPTGKIPIWVSFQGVPQFLFDNILAQMLKCARALLDGYIFVPQISEL